MNQGELLTRATIWLALCAYAIGAGMQISAGRHVEWRNCARVFWTFGCVFFLAHVASAFTYYHHWSHAAAYRETAERTGAMMGVRWGGGIYFNYVLALAWIADVGWWWFSRESLAVRSPRLNAIWQGFFFFMVFNGTVVFGRGPVRWLGVIICGGLAVIWWRNRRMTKRE